MSFNQVCIPSYWEMDDGGYGQNFYENGNSNGTPINGHTTCLYGPYSRYNNFMARTFMTSHDSSLEVNITVSATIWQLCTIDRGYDLIYENVFKISYFKIKLKKINIIFNFIFVSQFN